MAEPEPGPATATLSTHDPNPSEPKNPFSMLANWFLQFPFFNPGRNPGPPAREDPKPASSPLAVAEVEKEPARPTVVSFPVNRTIVVPPLATETEESSGKTHNPVVIWQVYAIGGFIVLKWVLARWKERQERAKKPDDDDNPSTEEFHEAPADHEE